MLGISYCTQCRLNLFRYGIPVSSLYEQICEFYFVTGRCLTIDTNKLCDFGIIGSLRFLELKGCIISTEKCTKSLSVKPLGLNYSNGDEEKIKLSCHVCFEKGIHNENNFDF